VQRCWFFAGWCVRLLLYWEIISVSYFERDSSLVLHNLLGFFTAWWL